MRMAFPYDKKIWKICLSQSNHANKKISFIFKFSKNTSKLMHQAFNYKTKKKKKIITHTNGSRIQSLLTCSMINNDLFCKWCVLRCRDICRRCRSSATRRRPDSRGVRNSPVVPGNLGTGR